MFNTLSRLALCAMVAAGGLAVRGEVGVGIAGRYWFDTPGETHPFTPGSFEIPTDGLDEGFHTFNAYVADPEGVSSTHSRLFVKVNKRWNETKPLSCTFYLDGRLFETRKMSAGEHGALAIDLDVNSVDLGLHTLGMTLVSEEGLPMGYRSAVFMRVPTDIQRSTFKAYCYLDGKYVGETEATSNNSLVHLDLDASSLVSGLHSVTVYLASPHGMATSTKTAWFVKIPEGGEGVREYSYWINDNPATVSTVSLPEVSNPFGLVKLVDVPEQPFRSCSYTLSLIHI